MVTEQVQESGNIPHSIASLNDRLVTVAKQVRVLGPLSWGNSVQQQFLSDWKVGKAKLPNPEYQIPPQTELIQELNDVAQSAAAIEHPIAAFLSRTASSYGKVCRLLDNAGSASALEFSESLYGRPSDLLPGGTVSNLDAANHFLAIAESFERAVGWQEPELCLSAQIMAEEMRSGLKRVFESDTIQVVIDPGMASKAAAGATRIRIRGGTCFSEYDLEQLLQHEAFIHSLTALNGRRHQKLDAFGLGAPRTTGAQEGLATFAELVTGAIDISRMERIALRVQAIANALDGADFIEVFRFFLDHDQVEMEAFNSAMRVFRGAPVTGGSAFTKDTVYLRGLMEVHTFFRWALLHERLDLCRWFFAGRMTIGDVLELSEQFSSGVLDGPHYLPPWIQRSNGLAGYLAFSAFANKIKLDNIGSDYAFDYSMWETTES